MTFRKHKFPSSCASGNPLSTIKMQMVSWKNLKTSSHAEKTHLYNMLEGAHLGSTPSQCRVLSGLWFSHQQNGERMWLCLFYSLLWTSNEMKHMNVFQSLQNNMWIKYANLLLLLSSSRARQWQRNLALLRSLPSTTVKCRDTWMSMRAKLISLKWETSRDAAPIFGFSVAGDSRRRE